jgi:hypothetical protein
MSKFESIKKKILELLNETSSEKAEVKIIVDNFNEINKKLSIFYSEIEKSLEECPLEENNEIKNFSLIDNTFINYLEAFVPKSFRYEINYCLMKFYNILFNKNYFFVLNNINETEQESVMINFCNISLKIINNFRGSPFFQLLIRKAHLYLNFIFQKKKNLRVVINELINGFSIPHSINFKDFKDNLKKSDVLSKCDSDSCKYKEEGINLLANLISEGVTFAEQFELLTLSAPDIINTLLKSPSDEYAKAYGRFGNLLCSLLYNTKFQITLDPNLLKPSNNQSISNDNVVIKSNFSTETENFKLTGNLPVGENYGKKIPGENEEEEELPKNITLILEDKKINIEEMNEKFDFLEKKNFELTFQKEILELNEQIVEICLLYVELIIQYDKIFPLQYISYLILRRIYFTFPKFIPNIGDKIIQAITNLSKFQGQFEWNTSLESRQFAYYLLLNDITLSKKIKSVTAVAPFDIRYQMFLLQKTNLSIGFNNWVTVYSGKMIERKIEVLDKNTLVYISVNMTEEDDDKDINIFIDKFDDNKNFWQNILNQVDVEFSQGLRKIIIYAKEPCLYRIIFDNTDSWFANKNILFRIVYLKECSNDDNETNI